MYKLISLFCSIILVFGLAACSKEKSNEQASTTPTASEQQQTPGTESAAPPAVPVKGKILETMDAAGYTYLRLETDAGEKWVAVNQTPVTVGDEVTYMDGFVMQNFESKTLNRTFPEIVFSSGLVPEGGTVPATATAGKGAESFSQALNTEGGAAGAAASGMVTGSKKAIVPFAEINVEKAPGDNSYTVAEIFSKAAELNGKTVIVRGKVMKVSPGIMGRNWIHIQDGTGNPDANTHDLVITTKEEPAADWDIITIEGILAANKDFGSGYKYAVLIEDANLKQ